MSLAKNDDIVATFHQFVNMTPHALATWLKTDESRAVGSKVSDGAESTGHKSGRHIVEVLKEKRAEYDENDLHEMHRIVGYIKRHLAQRPTGDTTQTRWAYSLKNWGHDPAKD